MDELELIRKYASSLLGDHNSTPDTIMRGSQLLRDAEEIEHNRTQTRKLRDDPFQGRLLQYMNLLAPIVTVLILAGTLFFQERDRARDAKQAAQDRADDQDKDLWSTAVKSVADTQGKDQTAAIVLLRGTEESSTRFGKEATNLIISILRDAKNFDDFHRLFSAAFTPPTQKNLDQILDVDRALHQGWVNKKNTDPDFHDSKGEHLVTQELSFLCTQVHPLLQKRPANKFFNLNFIAFFDCDLSNVDLTSADLKGFTTARVSMRGANLTGITKISDGYWKDTVWWDVASISPELGRNLCSGAPFTAYSVLHYGPRVLSATDYNDALKRLGLGDYCAPAK